MKIQLDKGAKMPQRAHATDAGLDIFAIETAVVPAQGCATFRTGVHIELPHGTAGLLKSKSGLNVLYDIVGEGVIDEGYSGEILVKLYNHGVKDRWIYAGDKISQLLIVPVLYEEPELVERIGGGERGDAGFGSTGR